MSNINKINKSLLASNLDTDIQLLTGNNFYITQDDYNVFEFYAMDISQTFEVSPTFIPSITSGQFFNVSSIAVLNVPLDNFSKLFKFKADDTYDINEVDTNLDWARENAATNNMYFGCEDTLAFSKVDFSNASVTVGMANNANIYKNKTTIREDYVRHLAKSITGGYAMSEIFTNEKELLEGVKSLDVNFRNNMKNILSESKSGGSSSIDGNIRDGLYKGNSIQGDNVALACQNLVAHLLSLNQPFKLNGEQRVINTDLKSLQRGQQFLNDLAAQTPDATGDNAFYVKFRKNDVLAIRLTYAPYGSTNGVDDNSNPLTSAPGYNPIYSRTYKIYLVMN